MLQPMPKRIFVACKDTATDDFYLFASFIDYINFKESYFRTAEATETIEDSAVRTTKLNSIVIIQLVFAHAPSWSYISRDYGRSWTTFFTVLPPGVLYSIYSRTTFYAIGGAYFFRSYDSGNSWTAIAYNPVGIDKPIFITIRNTLITVIYDKGQCARSPLLGTFGSWIVNSTGLPSVEKVIEVGNCLIAFSSTGSNARSTDGGSTWSAITPAPAAGTFRDAAMSDEDNRSILLALDNNKFYSSLDFGFTWIQMGTVITSSKYSLSHMVDFHFFGVNGDGYYDISNNNGETSDQLPFDVGNANIKPFSVFSLPEQPSKAFFSTIVQTVNKHSFVTKLKLSASKIFSAFVWYWFRCGENCCGEYLGGFAQSENAILSSKVATEQ